MEIKNIDGKFRVLLIQETIGSGGVERRRLSLAKYLDKHSFELKVVCTHRVGEIADEIEENGVEVIAIGRFRGIFDYAAYKKVLAIIKSYKPHIIHGAVFEGVTMATIGGWLARVPVIIIEETSDPITRSWKANLLMHFFGYFVDCAIGVSPASTLYLKRKALIPENKVVLINNGVKMPDKVSEEEVSTLKIKLGLEPDEIVIGSVGRMNDDSHKRFSDLIEALAVLKEKGLKAKLILVGDGPVRATYEEMASSMGLVDDIVFAGYQRNVDLYYSVFDIFSLVSAHEAFGLVLAEAMLHRLPLVVTKVGGMQYIVEDEVTGYLVERFDVQAIASKLETLCCDSAKRSQMGNEGYKRAVEFYTEESYIDSVAALYHKLLAKVN